MAPPAFPPPGSTKAKLMNRFVALNTLVYKLSGGRIGGKMADAPVLILHHVGRKTGAEREAPLCYGRDGSDYVIVASRGGSDAAPAWYGNLLAKPATTVRVGKDDVSVVAHEVTDQADYQKLWDLMAAIYPDYNVYQTRTERKIPVLRLSPA